ncbi:MAG: phosphatase PAP2 family protein [Bacteroidaceae bacterium]|nr:phosphatase PAP2 family protein [Bacteroidaceae bacterium]
MNKALLLGARVLSSIFRPQYYPLVGFLSLFLFTYLSLLPLPFKSLILLVVLLGTLLLPQLTIRFWRQMNGLKLHHLRLREKRFFPYIIFILYYAFTLHLLSRFRLPYYMGGILVGALMIQVSCFFINIWWKISAHNAGAGGVIGALVAYGFLFSFNPVWWLCLCILVAGLVGSSRMLLRQHTLWQVLAGTFLGIICGFLGIILKF